MFGSHTPWKYWWIHRFLPGYGTWALSGVLAHAFVAPRWAPWFSSTKQSLSIFFRKDTREDLLDQVSWAVSRCGPTNYCTGTTVVAVKAGIRGSSTCGASSAAVELKCRYLVLQCQDGLKRSEFHIMHYFQNPCKLQSQQIVRLTVGCPLAQGLVVGASRDIQRQKFRFLPLLSLAVPLLPHS